MKTIFISAYLLLYVGFSFGQVNETSKPFALNKAAAVNFVKIINATGGRDKTIAAQDANNFLNKLVQKGDVPIVFRDVAYISSDVDITEKVISSINSGGAGNSFEISDLKLHPLVMVINGEKVFNVSNQARQMQEKLRNEFSVRQYALRDEALGIKNDAEKLLSNKATIDAGEYRAQEITLAKRDKELQAKANVFKRDLNRRTFEERNEISKKVNPVIAQLAKTMDVSMVLQEAVYVRPSFDMTDTLISVLNQEKTLEQAVATLPKERAPIQIGFIDTERVFSASPPKTMPLSQEDMLKHRSEVAQKINPIIKAFAEKNGLDIVVQSPEIADKRFDITTKIIELMGPVLEPRPSQSLSSQEGVSLIDARQKCMDLGFKEKSEAFGKCVLRLSK
jgi:Skp family chaperone for outer membrane proteins